MADRTKQENELEKTETKKQPWTVKRVLTTAIIVILALLMVGGVSYIFMMFQQDKDTTNVFGYYNGKPIKLAYNTVFYNTLMSDQNYINAVTTGDYNAVYSSYNTAYQAEAIYQVLSAMADDAKIVTPKKVVDKMVIESGQFAGEDGQTFDPEVYKSASIADKAAVENNAKMLYPYEVVGTDLYSTVVSQQEQDFVKALAEDAVDLSYFAIDFNAYPDDLALAYDISEMTKITDADGNEVEPTLSEIKAFIATKEPEKIQQAIDDKLVLAMAGLETSFEDAAAAVGSKIYTLNGVAYNPYNSSYLSGISASDPVGSLTAVADVDLTKTLFTEKTGYVAGPISAEDGSYVFVKVDSDNSETNNSAITTLMYQYYGLQQPFYDTAQNAFASDKFEDNFMTAFWTMLIGNVASAN